MHAWALDRYLILNLSQDLNFIQISVSKNGEHGASCSVHFKLRVMNIEGSLYTFARHTIRTHWPHVQDVNDLCMDPHAVALGWPCAFR